MQPPAFRWCPMPENGHPVHTENEIGRKWTGQGGSRRWRCGAISMLCSRAMPTRLFRRRSQKKDAGRRISKSSAFEITSWTGSSTAMQPEDAPQKVFSQCRVFHAPRVTETEKETNAPSWLEMKKARCPSFTESLVVWKIRLRERREEGPFGLILFSALIYLYFMFEKFT